MTIHMYNYSHFSYENDENDESDEWTCEKIGEKSDET